MRRLEIILLVALLGFSHAATAAPEFRLGTLQAVAQGGMARLSLRLGGATEDYAGINARILLPQGVTCENVLHGDALASGFTLRWEPLSGGQNGVAVVTCSRDRTFQDGALLDFYLRVAANVPPGSYPIAFPADKTVVVNGKHALSNSDGSSSVEHVVVGGSITVTSLGSPTLTVDPLTQSVPAAGGTTAAFNVATTTAWTAASDQAWATVNGGSRTGDGSFTVTCTANSGAGSRTATVTVTGTAVAPDTGTVTVAVTVTQASSAAPTLAVTPLTQSVPAAGGTSAAFNVATTAAWTAASDQTWATVNGDSGTGNGTFTVTCTANSGAGSRTATVTVTGTGTQPGAVAVTVTQASSAAPTLAVTPLTQSVPAAGGTSAAFNVATTAAWTAASDQTWATVNGGSGTGDGTFTVTCTANSGAGSRTATVTVTGAGTQPGAVAVTVTQASSAAPTLAVTPLTQSVPAAGGTSAAFNVATTAAWTAASDQTWATVNGGSGTGNGTFTVTCTANSGAGSRTATVTVAGTGTSPESVQVAVNQAAGTRRTLTVTVSPANAGTVTKNPLPDAADGKYADGTQVTLTANPNNGYTFASWTGGASGTNPSVQVTMSADVTVTANFTPEPGDWESTEFVRTVNYYDCWERNGYVKVPGATEVRLVLGAYDIETNADTLSTSAGDNIAGQSSTPFTTSTATGDTMSLTLRSNDSVTGYITFARVEYKGAASGAAIEVGGDFFNGSQEGDCPAPCCGCAGGKANGIEALKKNFGDLLVFLFGAVALIAISSRKPFGL
ncbi:MAG: BACON domain-containing protein [Candidatus Hydrogenedentes bacterium]|nr:BACON domain-containing protein [Candidatus Hydrogenedentota bacterium]